MTLEEWKKKVKYRRYSHFDRKISLQEAWNYISNPRKVKAHSFYPFIQFTITINKYNKEKGKTRKQREVCYSAHMDRYIYQYYSYLLNETYNLRLVADGLNDCVIAYRNNLHMNNIHFAKRAFDKIRELRDCYVIIGDFTSFFDSLDHQYLKERICDLLQVEKLPEDYYAVYRNITRFSIWKLSDSLKENNLSNNYYGVRAFNKQNLALPWEKFKALKKESIERHVARYGIPQGSSISAVLSNIYMLEFDAKLFSYATNKDGLYMRYSDDFIMILPKKSVVKISDEIDYLRSTVFETPSLELEPSKTQLFEINNGNIEAFELRDQCIHSIKTNKINYLGFSYDGSSVFIRDRTISKYYNKLNRSIKRINNSLHYSKTKMIIKCKRLYKKYGNPRGTDNNKKPNFLTYVSNSESVFGPSERVGLVRRRHIKKIRRKLNSHDG